MPVSFLNLEGARLEVAEYAEISINNIIWRRYANEARSDVSKFNSSRFVASSEGMSQTTNFLATAGWNLSIFRLFNFLKYLNDTFPPKIAASYW